MDFFESVGIFDAPCHWMCSSIGHDTSILLYKYLWIYIQIFPLVGGKLIFDSSRLQEGIFVYTLVKSYNKAKDQPNSVLYQITSFKKRLWHHIHKYVLISIYKCIQEFTKNGILLYRKIKGKSLKASLLTSFTRIEQRKVQHKPY